MENYEIIVCGIDVKMFIEDCKRMNILMNDTYAISFHTNKGDIKFTFHDVKFPNAQGIMLFVDSDSQWYEIKDQYDRVEMLYPNVPIIICAGDYSIELLSLLRKFKGDDIQLLDLLK